MSDDRSGPPHSSPTGRGSTGGGGDIVSSQNAGTPCSSPVTNQTLLVVDSHLHEHLSPRQSLRLALIQLEFARDVSSRAAVAYDQILDELRKPADRA
jgi:hypothetical protein